MAVSAVTREPTGSSTRTSTDSFGPMMAKRFMPSTVTRWPSKATFACSAARTSAGRSGLVGVTVTTVSLRSVAMTSSAPTWRSTERSIGVGVS